MGRLNVNLLGIELDNPIIPASGTFGYGHEMADLYDINMLGTFSFKGTTAEPRFGNEQPRIAEAPAGILNAIGLQNPGVHAVVEEEIPSMRKCFHKLVMANVCGFSEEEYALVARKLSALPEVGWIELNISCPNVHDGGMAFGTDPACAESVVRTVKEVCEKPLIVKLTPNVTDIVEIAKACESGGADGLSLINTMLGMRINLRTGKPLLANTTGGLSGPAVFPIALRMVYQVSKAVSLPVIGMGGISSAEDVLEMMMAGATAVQIGAAGLKNPYICKEIIESLPKTMDDHGIENLRDIIGRAH